MTIFFSKFLAIVVLSITLTTALVHKKSNAEDGIPVGSKQKIVTKARPGVTKSDSDVSKSHFSFLKARDINYRGLAQNVNTLHKSKSRSEVIKNLQYAGHRQDPQTVIPDPQVGDIAEGVVDEVTQVADNVADGVQQSAQKVADGAKKVAEDLRKEVTDGGTIPFLSPEPSHAQEYQGSLQGDEAPKECTLDPTTESPFYVGKDATCPRQCPFSQKIAGDQCSKVCLHETGCEDFSNLETFADPYTKKCSFPCGLALDARIPACRRCTSYGVCAECAGTFFGKFKLSEDGKKCLSSSEWIWPIVLKILGTIFVMVLLALYLLKSRTVENQEGFNRAWEHRVMTVASPAAPDNREDIPRYPIPGTNVHDEDICGIDVKFYFDTLLILGIVCICLVTGTFWAYLELYNKTTDSVGSVVDCQAQGIAAEIDSNKFSDSEENVLHNLISQSKYLIYEGRMFYATAVGYLVSVCLMWYQASRIKKRSDNFYHGIHHEHRYTFKITNVPPEISDANQIIDLVTKEFPECQEDADDDDTFAAFANIDFADLANAAVRDVNAALRDAAVATGYRDNATAVLGSSSSADGLTASAGAREKKFTQLLRREDIVGASIAYDWVEHADLVDEAIEAIIFRNDTTYKEMNDLRLDRPPISPEATPRGDQGDDVSPGKSPSKGAVGGDTGGVSSPTKRAISFIPTRAEATISLKRRYRSAKSWTRQTISKLDKIILLATSAKLETKREAITRQATINERIKPALEKIKGQGTVFIVCHSDKVATQAVKRSRILEQKGRPMTFVDPQTGQETLVNFSTNDYDPPELNWHCYTRKSTLLDRIAGYGLLFAAVFLWMSGYVPYALDYVSYTQIPGVNPSIYGELSLGVIIGLGNVLVAVVVESVTPWWREVYKFQHEKRQFVTGFAFYFIQTFLDIVLVLEIARGTQINKAFEGGGVGNNYDRVLANQLFFLIFPGYIMLPYIAETFCDSLALTYLAGLSIRGRSDLDHRQAELAISGPRFDICWKFCDMVNNFTICSVMLAFQTPNNFKVFGVLLFAIVWIYFVDYHRLLRFCQKNYFETPILSRTFLNYWCIPSSVMLGSAVLWYCKYQNISEDRPRLVMEAILIHLVVYLGVLYLIQRKNAKLIESSGSLHDTAEGLGPLYNREKVDKNLAEMKYGDLRVENAVTYGRYFDYFNMNPVFVLRQEYLNKKEPWHPTDGSRKICPHVSGKQYLLIDEKMKAMGKSKRDVGVQMARHFGRTRSPQRDKSLHMPGKSV